jgi:protein-tyrosine phosphatase
VRPKFLQKSAFRGPGLVIDLHSHLLPGLDDGAQDLATSLMMARQAVAQGVTHMACTPHILPGVYHNHGPDIRNAIKRLQDELNRHEIPLQLVSGADVHMAPNFVAGLKSGELLTIAIALRAGGTAARPPQIEEFLLLEID